MNTVDQAIKLVRNWRRHKAVLHPRTAQFLFHWMRGSTVLPYPPLKLHLEPNEQDLRLYNPKTGRWLLTPEEDRAEKQRMEIENARLRGQLEALKMLRGNGSKR